jgi:hypothetical protein
LAIEIADALDATHSEGTSTATSSHGTYSSPSANRPSLNRRRAFSNDSPSCSRTSANLTTSRPATNCARLSLPHFRSNSLPLLQTPKRDLRGQRCVIGEVITTSSASCSICGHAGTSPRAVVRSGVCYHPPAFQVRDAIAKQETTTEEFYKLWMIFVHVQDHPRRATQRARSPHQSQ